MSALPAQAVAVRPSRALANLNRLFWRTVLYLVVALGAVSFFIPFYWMARTAVMPPYQIYAFPPDWIPHSINFVSFRVPFDNYPFARWFVNSTVISLASVIGVGLSSSLVGFGFARLRMPFRDTLFVIVLSTMMLPEQVRLVPTYLLVVTLGWANTYYPLIIPMFLAPAFFVFLMRQFFMTIPPEMDDAAYIDGCSPIGVYWRIALPLSLPALGVVAIYAFTQSWNDFLHPLIYLQKLEILTVAVGLRFMSGSSSVDIQPMMAAALLSALPMIALFFVAQRYFVQGIVVTGLKG
jgi:ABC-type glycerol-3-phosphate transport system permease component